MSWKAWLFMNCKFYFSCFRIFKCLLVQKNKLLNEVIVRNIPVFYKKEYFHDSPTISTTTQCTIITQVWFQLSIPQITSGLEYITPQQTWEGYWYQIQSGENQSHHTINSPLVNSKGKQILHLHLNNISERHTQDEKNLQ